MLKAFKTEIAPDKVQAQKIRQSIENCRWLYNQYIAYNLKLYRMYRQDFWTKIKSIFCQAITSIKSLITNSRKFQSLSG